MANETIVERENREYRNFLAGQEDRLRAEHQIGPHKDKDPCPGFPPTFADLLRQKAKE